MEDEDEEERGGEEEAISTKEGETEEAEVTVTGCQGSEFDNFSSIPQDDIFSGSDKYSENRQGRVNQEARGAL